MLIREITLQKRIFTFLNILLQYFAKFQNCGVMRRIAFKRRKPLISPHAPLKNSTKDILVKFLNTKQRIANREATSEWGVIGSERSLISCIRTVHCARPFFVLSVMRCTTDKCLYVMCFRSFWNRPKAVVEAQAYMIKCSGSYR